MIFIDSVLEDELKQLYVDEYINFCTTSDVLSEKVA